MMILVIGLTAQGKDSTGDYFAVKGDFSGYTNGISVGYQYKYEVILPKFYFKLAQRITLLTTPTLTVNRVKFAIGLSGGVQFKLKAMGSDEWVDIQHVTDADCYEADLDPLVQETMMTVPINQRNKYFNLKLQATYFPGFSCVYDVGRTIHLDSTGELDV